MNWIKQKIINWLGLNIIHKKINNQEYELIKLIKIIKERTEYHIDVHGHAKSSSYMILIGKYHNRDFIKCYPINDYDLSQLVERCRGEEKYANRGRIDAHPELSAVINNKLNHY